jgi:Photosystem II 4 kDa reaction centre component
MTDKEMIDVIQENAESLRKEVSSRIESDLKFGQMLVAGVAAIAVLKPDVNIKDFLPIVPVLVLLLIFVWQQSEFSLFRLGKRLAKEEQKINTLAGRDLLEHETALWAERSRWFPKLEGGRLILNCVVVAFAFYLIHLFMPGSKLNDRDISWLTYATSGVIAFQILNVFRRECQLFK